MRQDSDFFNDLELELVYMARRLREALRLEKLLTDAGIDYLVETGTYIGGFLMRRNLAGAFFYVAPAQVSAARDVLSRHRIKPYTPTD